MMEFQDEKTCQDYRDEIADLKDTLYVAEKRIESLHEILIEIANPSGDLDWAAGLASKALADLWNESY